MARKETHPPFPPGTTSVAWPRRDGRQWPLPCCVVAQGFVPEASHITRCASDIGPSAFSRSLDKTAMREAICIHIGQATVLTSKKTVFRCVLKHSCLDVPQMSLKEAEADMCIENSHVWERTSGTFRAPEWNSIPVASQLVAKECSIKTHLDTCFEIAQPTCTTAHIDSSQRERLQAT